VNLYVSLNLPFDAKAKNYPESACSKDQLKPHGFTEAQHWIPIQLVCLYQKYMYMFI